MLHLHHVQNPCIQPSSNPQITLGSLIMSLFTIAILLRTSPHSCIPSYPFNSHILSTLDSSRHINARLFSLLQYGIFHERSHCHRSNPHSLKVPQGLVPVRCDILDARVYRSDTTYRDIFVFNIDFFIIFLNQSEGSCEYHSENRKVIFIDATTNELSGVTEITLSHIVHRASVCVHMGVRSVVIRSSGIIMGGKRQALVKQLESSLAGLIHQSVLFLDCNHGHCWIW